jgi:hypothetical protein
LRQAARDLHRLQSKYDPTTTSETNNSNPDGSSAEQTRYFIICFLNEIISFLSFNFSKLITRELQEWHKQQVSKYKTSPTVSTNDSQINNDRIPSPISHSEESDNMIASVLPLSSDDSRTICSSSFIMTEEPIILPKVIAESLSITDDNSIHQDNPRLVIE